jgi:hypothetical protein
MYELFGNQQTPSYVYGTREDGFLNVTLTRLDLLHTISAAKPGGAVLVNAAIHFIVIAVF